MSETVKLGQGSLDDVKIEWSISDADGNPITTSLKSIDGYRETVNSNVVSKLNFESFTITEDMQFNGTQIKPLRIINCSYIYDGSNNKMKADTETEKFFEPVISHQSFLDIKGPTVEVVEGYKAQAEELIEIINNPCSYFSCRFFWFIWDCLTWKWSGILYVFSNLFGC